MSTRKIRIKKLAAVTDTCPPTIRKYIKLKLITDCERDSNGNWNFGDGAAEQVRLAKALRNERADGREAAAAAA